jgi:hypothetical protein
MSTVVEARRTVIRTVPVFFMNSVLAVTIGIVVARLVELSAVALAGAVAGRDPVIRLSGVELRAAGSDWVALAAPVAGVFVGLVLLLLYPGSRDRSPGRLAMLWTMLFCFRAGLVGFASGALDESTALGSELASLDLPGGIDIVIAVAALLALALVAVGAAPAFLSFARHRSEVGTRLERMRFAASIVLVPAIVGPLLAIPMFLPDASGFIGTLPTIGLFVLLTVICAPFTTAFRPPEVVEERGLSLGLVAGLAFVIVFMRFGIGSGMPIPPWDESLNLTWRA